MRERMTLWLASLLGMIAMGVGLVAGWQIHGEPATKAATPAPAVTVTVPVELPGMTMMRQGAGTYRVPQQVPPGVYAVGARSRVTDCWWSRRLDLGTSGKSIIASGQIKRDDRDLLLVVQRGDRYLRLLGDCQIVRQPSGV